MATGSIVFAKTIWTILSFMCSPARSEYNVALNKHAEQSSDYADHERRWVASKAVDGWLSRDIYSNCCTHTRLKETEAFWRVDMGELMTVNNITIYYRDQYQHRFGGYHLYLSNTTDTPTDGVLCYKDQSRNKADVQLVVTHECPYVARYVTVYNYRNDTKRRSWYTDYAVLELCEVEVFGCPKGIYGSGNCNRQCSPACYGGNCDPITGACFYCFPGKYGEFCNKECPTNCKANSCEKDSGFCFDCKDMFFGSTCNPCSTGCADPICNKTTGNCNSCKAEFHGSKCDQSCPSNCNKCFQNIGFCADCVAGLYGLDCTKSCPINCVDECDRSTAECKACQVGHYGLTCDKNCSDQCMDVRCKQTDGHCERCVDGYHGYFCSEVCPENCINNVCFQENGHCTVTSQAEKSSITDEAIGIGTVCGLVIVILVMIVIVLVRRLSRIQSENNEHSHVTSMSGLSRGEANKDVTYSEVERQGCGEDNY